MTRRDVIGVLAGGVAASALGGCAGSRRHTFRFRETVEVETPQGLKTGSSVMEVSVTKGAFKFPGTTGFGIQFKGEAVAVDLSGGHILFALVVDGFTYKDFNGGLTGASMLDTAFRSFSPGTLVDEVLFARFADLEQRSSIGRTVEVAAKYLPPLVRFRDIRDPKTVELVEPNDLAKSFGAGMTLKRILLTVTDEPVTLGIEKRLAQIGFGPNRPLDPTKYPSGVSTWPKNPTVAQKLQYIDFVRGF